MNLLPPIPSWDAIHPMLVHFPIALLLVAPLGLVAALFTARHARALCVASFALSALGTIGLFVAAGAGEAAGELAHGSKAMEAVLESHEELAETARLLFAGLTILLGLTLFAPRLFQRPLPRSVQIGVVAVLLALYAGSGVVLANTAHLGGRLVHEFGVRAQIAPAAPAESLTAGAAADREGERGEGERDAERDDSD